MLLLPLSETDYRHRWEDDIKMDLSDVGQGLGLDSPRSEKRQVVSACECGSEPSGPIKIGGIS